MKLTFSKDRYSFTITANKEERTNLRESLENDNSGDDSIFMDFIEYYRVNGYITDVSPEEVGALTDSLLLAEWADRDDYGKLTDVGKVYWFRDYQIVGLCQTLVDYGQITFYADGE